MFGQAPHQIVSDADVQRRPRPIRKDIVVVGFHRGGEFDANGGLRKYTSVVMLIALVQRLTPSEGHSLSDPLSPPSPHRTRGQALQSRGTMSGRSRAKRGSDRCPQNGGRSSRTRAPLEVRALCAARARAVRDLTASASAPASSHGTCGSSTAPVRDSSPPDR